MPGGIPTATAGTGPISSLRVGDVIHILVHTGDFSQRVESDTAATSDAMKLDGTTEATLARSLSALPPDERGWITEMGSGITASQYS
jgi:hypothetical protein